MMERLKYKVVVFDFDGTLADSFPWFLKTVNAVAEKYSFNRVELHDLERLRGLSGQELIAHLQMPLWKVPIITAEMRRLMTACASEIRLFDGVERMLRLLSAHGIEAAVLSSNSPENVKRILGERNVSHIRHLECGAPIFGKEAKFRKLLRRTRIPREQVLCIGDEIRDAQAAEAAGLTFVGVAWGYTRPDVLAAHSSRAPFRTVDEITESLCTG